MAFRKIRPKRLRKVKTGNSQEVLRRLDDYLKTECDEPVEILCGFWKDQQDAITYQELRQAVLDGTLTVETIELWRQDYSILVSERLNDMWTKAIAAGPGGQPILDGIALEFNTQTPGILNWIRERGAEFVTACAQEQKDAISALLTKKMCDGHTVDELSRMIRPCIGLTAGDAKAATRLYENIAANLKKEHPRMKPESIRKKALDATQKYAERKHRARAMTIAQTESVFAYNRGADEGIRQAQEQNWIGKCMKRWSTSGDDAVCGICASLEGVEVGMDSDFNIGGRLLFSGQHMLPPAHPRCACAVQYIEVEKPVFGLASGTQINQEPTGNAIEYLGAIDNVSDDIVKSTLEEYEQKIVSSSVENAVIITKDGLMWQCLGGKNSVLRESFGIELSGASVTHNHPLGSANEYSFSKHDINFFMDENLKVLRGIDDLFVYELTRNPKELDEHIAIWEFDEYSTRHEEVISMAEKLGIGYRRHRHE